jgi:hypothetical protein
MLEHHLAVPFSTGVLGMTVTVETLDMRFELVRFLDEMGLAATLC